MLSSILKPGTSIDIKVLQQLEKGESKCHVLKSRVYDVKENGELEIGMPVADGKLILLPLGVRYEMVFSTKSGLYRSIGEVKERYKSGNLYMIVVELKENLSKCQRREYYRMECLLDIEYMPLTSEEMQMETDEEIMKHHYQKSSSEYMRNGTAVDVSGGGMRFIANDELLVPTDILMKMCIKNGDEDEEIYLRGTILSGKKIESNTNKHEYRVKFILENGRVREEIIRYIFEEERKGRNSKKG